MSDVSESSLNDKIVPAQSVQYDLTSTPISHKSAARIPKSSINTNYKCSQFSSRRGLQEHEHITVVKCCQASSVFVNDSQHMLWTNLLICIESKVLVTRIEAKTCVDLVFIL